MKRLSLLARITTPAAMLVFISYEMSHSLDVTGLWYYFLLIGSLASAVGIEIIGILGGHVLDTAWRLNDTLRAFLAMGLLVCYTAVAMYVLRQNSILVAIPIVAAVVYLLAALADGLETAENKIDEQAAAEQDYRIEKRRADDELARKMQIAALRLKHDEKMARITVKETARSRQDVRQDATTGGDLPTDWRQLSGQQKVELSHLTREEREIMLPDMAPRTRREWHNRLDKLAANNGQVTIQGIEQ